MVNKENEFLESVLEFSEFDAVNYQYFNQLLRHRTVVLNNEVDANLMEKVYLPLRDFEKDDSDEPVTLVISTPGGSIDDSLFLCDYLKTYKKKLTIEVCGYACSMGTAILAAAGMNPNITRIAYPNSHFLIHDGYFALGGATEAKTADDVMAFNKSLIKRIEEIILLGTKITKKEYSNKTRKQWFMYADEAKEKGIIDKIIGVDEE